MIGWLCPSSTYGHEAHIKWRDDAHPYYTGFVLHAILLDGAIVVMDLAQKGSSIPPAKDVFATIGIILVTIKVSLLFFSDNLLQVNTELGLDGQRTGSSPYIYI